MARRHLQRSFRYVSPRVNRTKVFLKPKLKALNKSKKGQKTMHQTARFLSKIIFLNATSSSILVALICSSAMAPSSETILSRQTHLFPVGSVRSNGWPLRHIPTRMATHQCAGDRLRRVVLLPFSDFPDSSHSSLCHQHGLRRSLHDSTPPKLQTLQRRQRLDGHKQSIHLHLLRLHSLQIVCHWFECRAIGVSRNRRRGSSRRRAHRWARAPR